ncbi:DUF3168 domain-containing protein [Mycobacterium sp. KBS0706]|uniref:DUF3168 domain-containing protein n=1 Tax=Mycobacterium sp. KBS0706 TaxID=2578109 RepID=UPI00110FD93E|nr:DUF3168 domain-containing protein [Mycobacterium sp. KBS0706]TSD85622.1 DUF3168 domain-containing protein [Mycobacterium sp. KBS0706]
MSGRDLSGPLRRAMIATLQADPGVAAQVGTRVYDYVSTAPAYPFLRCTTVIASPWEATGGVRGSLVRLQVDAFTKGYGRASAEPLAAAVVAALDEADLALPEGFLVSLQWRQTRMLDDPAEQGVVHGVIEFETIAAA